MQTVTRETAQKMKEKGWKRTTHFVYFFDSASREWVVATEIEAINYPYAGDFFPAPTLAEVLEELPKTILIERCSEPLGGWIITPQTGELTGQSYWSANVCEAAAQVWLGKEAR